MDVEPPGTFWHVKEKCGREDSIAAYYNETALAPVQKVSHDHGEKDAKHDSRGAAGSK